MLRQVVISLVASVLLGVTLGGLISNSGEAGVEKTQAKSAATAKRRGSSLPVVALVYAQRTDEGRRAEVRWQRLRWLNSSLLYTARPSRWSLHSVPDELGFLPSPDGRWLLVWDTVRRETDGQPLTDTDGSPVYDTVWSAIPLPAGRVVTVGHSEGLGWLLPHWEDSRRLVLTGDVTLRDDSEAALFDVETGTLSRPLPRLRWNHLPSPWLADLVAEARLAL